MKFTVSRTDYSETPADEDAIRVQAGADSLQEARALLDEWAREFQRTNMGRTLLIHVGNRLLVNIDQYPLAQ